MMAQGVPAKRQFQPIMDADTMYRELSHPIRKHDTVSQPRLYQPMSDCDTVCPPKKRALFDYNREQARKIYSAENGRTQFQLDESPDDYSKNQFHSNININRQAFFSNKLKLDRLEHDVEIRPRSDSLHSISSQFSEISSIDSTNSSSRESSPVMGQDIHKHETQLRKSIIHVNGSDSNNLLHTEKISELSVNNDAEKNIIAKDHETPERNPMLVLNGIKSDIQKPLFTNSSPISGDIDKSKPVISKTLFPLDQADIQSFELNLSQNKEYLSQNHIPNKTGESFQCSDIPASENNKFFPSSKKNLTTLESTENKLLDSSVKKNLDVEKKSSEGTVYKNYSNNNNVICRSSENTEALKDENSRRRENDIRKSSRVLGDVTNSLNINKKLDENKSVLGMVTDRNNVETNLMEQNGNIQEAFTCSLCSEQFQQYENFDNHMKLHEKRIKICKCDICEATFDNSNLRKAHMRAAHSGSGSQPYQCEKCNREFSQFNNLRRHMRVHREKTYKCHLCDRVFNEEFYLKMHVGTHTGQRVYSCGVCNAPFQSNQELKAHVKTHSPSQLHNCNICGKSFSKACVLRQHKKTHSGERPHHCISCGKTFIHRHHLTMHMRSHAENKPFTCDLCSKEFSQTSHLYKHLRQHEEENLENSTHNGLRDESNATQKRIDKGHENNSSCHIQKGIRKSKKENLENLDPNDAKGRTQRKKSEPRTQKNSNVAMNNYSEATLQERNRNQEINGHFGQNINHQIGGIVTEKIKNTNSTKRSIEFALNEFEKSRPKKLKSLQQNTETDRALSQITTESYSRPEVQTARPLPGHSFGTSLSSVSTAPTKLPSFNSITSGLKESYPKWPATNTPTSMPYYQAPSYEQNLYPYGYPSMGYGSSSMYLAYSAQMQAYYNMLYYNSKALVNHQYQSTENGNTKPNTSVVSEQMSKEIQTSKVELEKRGVDSENNRYNNSWYESPKFTSTVNIRETKTADKNVDVFDKHGKETEMGEKQKSVKRNNILLIAALKEGTSTETDIRSETHTNEHILKLRKLKDRLIEEPVTSNHDVTGHLTESKGRNQICSVEAGAVNNIEKPSVDDEIPVDQVNDAAVIHETNRNYFDRHQNIDENMNLELGDGKKMDTYHVNQRTKIDELDKQCMSEYNFKNQNLKMASESTSDVDRIAESTTVETETDTLENNQTQNDRNKEFEHSKNFICCDTCSFTFCGKDDLKKHFIENPVCFSKVCQTSKISEEFGWQLLDYYLASLEMYKSNKTDNETSYGYEVASFGGTSLGTIEQTTRSEGQQTTNNMKCLNVEVCVDSKLGVEPQKPKDHVVLENDRPDSVINGNKDVVENHKQIVIDIAQNHPAENLATEVAETVDIEKHRDGGSLSDISETLSNEEHFKDSTNLHSHSIPQLTGSSSMEVIQYSQERMCDNISYESKKKQESNVSIRDSEQPIMEKSYLTVLNKTGNDKILSVEKKEEWDILNEKKDNTKQSGIYEEQKFICQFCEAEFKDGKTLDSHIQTHPSDKPFTCVQCSRNFTHKHNLKRHMMSHSDRCVECLVCKRSFKENYYLQMHMKVHLEPDAKKCEICGELVAKVDISNHVKGHIGPIEENPTYLQIGGRVQEILKENEEIKNENTKSDVLDLSNKQVTKESLMKMSVEQLKSVMIKGKSNYVE